MKSKVKPAATAIALIIIAVVCTLIVKQIQKNTDTGNTADKTAQSGEVKYSLMEEHFGTILTITLYGSDEEKLKEITETSFDECERLENIFSAKLSGSELSRLNEQAALEPVEVSDELMYLIKEALAYNRLSDGALDMSIGKLVNMWGIGTENQRVPDAEELRPYMNADGCSSIIIDEENNTVFYNSDLVNIDLGAIAKGYAADCIKQYICNNMDAPYGILDFGGNIMTIGQKGDGSSWNIGITNPKSPSQVYGVVSVKDMCVVTSGNYERYFIENGVRYHHILNPLTGYPADTGIISSTIIGDNSMQCDALSTACYILGVDKSLELIDSMEGVEAVFIDNDGNVHTSKDISRYNFIVKQ